jgi:predicted RNase H-like HicB family nuclease
MAFEDYKVVLYRDQPDGWVAEISAIPGCYALATERAQALADLSSVFEMIAAEYAERGLSLPQATTEIVNA